MLMGMWAFLCREITRPLHVGCNCVLITVTVLLWGADSISGCFYVPLLHTVWQAGLRSTLISSCWASREPDRLTILWAVPEATPSGHSVALFIVKLVQNSVGLHCRIPPQSNTFILFWFCKTRETLIRGGATHSEMTHSRCRHKVRSLPGDWTWAYRTCWQQL